MSVPNIIGFAVLFILQAVTTFIFLKVEIPKPSKKSLAMKMTCSTIFILNALLAMLTAGNFSNYTFFILIGLAFSWVGDFLLHYKVTENWFIAGVMTFMCGHIFYIAAFLNVQRTYFPDAPFLDFTEALLMIAGICFSQFRLYTHKAEYGKAFLPCTVYMNVIMIMLVKALWLSIRFIMNGTVENALATGIILALGAGLFTLSDFTLALLRFTHRYSQSYAIRKVNIWTYFYAQMLLGLTILNIAV